jgi:hypothetical protein
MNLLRLSPYAETGWPVTRGVFAVAWFAVSLGITSSVAKAESNQGDPAPTTNAVRSAAAGGSSTSSARLLATIRQGLQANFDRLLAEPGRYQERVRKECGRFPEGKIFPYALPALAYAHLAIADPAKKDHARAQMVKLIDLAIPSVAREIQAPGGDLLRLPDYQEQATYLATLNLVLGAFELSTGDDRYARLHDLLSKLLDAALRGQKGGPIRSYPSDSWNFDTIVALASLDVHDRLRKTMQASELVKAHLLWIDQRGTDRDTELPYSAGWNGSGKMPSPPRGCDLSFRVCLMAQFAGAEARTLYARYVARNWVDQGVFSGFSEWPRGGSREVPDVDSGPVFMGIGATASGVGLGAAIAMGDEVRLQRLPVELTMVQTFIQAMGSKTPSKAVFPEAVQWFEALGLSPDRQYTTGFLYGDAALFYAVTWTRYPESTTPK